MAELNEVFNQPKDVEIGGRTFKGVKKLTLGDYAKFYDWCDKKYKREVIETYKMADQKPDVMEVMRLKADEQYYTAMMGTVEGLAHLLYMIVSKSNEITEEELHELLTLDDLPTITNVISDNIEVETTEGNSKNSDIPLN